MQLAVHRWGSGPPVVLVHGGVSAGRETWWAQKPLTERWSLIAPDRPGNGASPGTSNDYLLDARLLVDQVLTEPSHLVGYSYGGLGAVVAAAQAPELVRTLTVVEPPAPRAAAPSRAVDAWSGEFDAKVRELKADPARLLAWFFAFIGVDMPVPDPLPDWMEKGARAFDGGRSPADADLPLAEIRASRTPVMVVSGGHDPVLEAICDGIAVATGGRREVVSGARHLVPATGKPFNALLEEFWGAPVPPG